MALEGLELIGTTETRRDLIVKDIKRELEEIEKSSHISAHDIGRLITLDSAYATSADIFIEDPTYRQRLGDLMKKYFESIKTKDNIRDGVDGLLRTLDSRLDEMKGRLNIPIDYYYSKAVAAIISSSIYLINSGNKDLGKNIMKVILESIFSIKNINIESVLDKLKKDWEKDIENITTSIGLYGILSTILSDYLKGPNVEAAFAEIPQDTKIKNFLDAVRGPMKKQINFKAVPYMNPEVRDYLDKIINDISNVIADIRLRSPFIFLKNILLQKIMLENIIRAVLIVQQNRKAEDILPEEIESYYSNVVEGKVKDPVSKILNEKIAKFFKKGIILRKKYDLRKICNAILWYTYHYGVPEENYPPLKEFRSYIVDSFSKLFLRVINLAKFLEFIVDSCNTILDYVEKHGTWVDKRHSAFRSIVSLFEYKCPVKVSIDREKFAEVLNKEGYSLPNDIIKYIPSLHEVIQKIVEQGIHQMPKGRYVLKGKSLEVIIDENNKIQFELKVQSREFREFFKEVRNYKDKQKVLQNSVYSTMDILINAEDVISSIRSIAESLEGLRYLIAFIRGLEDPPLRDGEILYEIFKNAYSNGSLYPFDRYYFKRSIEESISSAAKEILDTVKSIMEEVVVYCSDEEYRISDIRRKFSEIYKKACGGENSLLTRAEKLCGEMYGLGF